jgi:hypothetical protein
MRDRFFPLIFCLIFVMLLTKVGEADIATGATTSLATVPTITALATAATRSAPSFSWGNFVPDHIGVALQAGTKGNSTSVGAEISATNLLTNYGITARSWSNGSGLDLGIYAGIGFGNILQLQAGHSTETGFLLRLRSDYPLALTGDAWKEFYRRKYWMISPFVEVPLTRHHGTVFGLGLGRTF